MSSQSPLVAVVDDEPEVRRALQRLLRSAGFAVEVYASGAAFLDGLPDHRPDCLVLDLHMPGSDGFALQDALSRRGSMIPVVMITGGESVGARACLDRRCQRLPVQADGGHRVAGGDPRRDRRDALIRQAAQPAPRAIRSRRRTGRR